jgi:hypothetical protein
MKEINRRKWLMGMARSTLSYVLRQPAKYPARKIQLLLSTRAGSLRIDR